jgi:hypothetical protein
VAGDYQAIHDFLDSSKSALADNRHRALTHTTWFIATVIERVFGHTLTNSAGRQVSTRQIAEDHVLEDYGGRFIPTAQDFFDGMEYAEWMNNGRGDKMPPSFKRVGERRTREEVTFNLPTRME